MSTLYTLPEKRNACLTILTRQTHPQPSSIIATMIDCTKLISKSSKCLTDAPNWLNVVNQARYESFHIHTPIMVWHRNLEPSEDRLLISCQFWTSQWLDRWTMCLLHNAHLLNLRQNVQLVLRSTAQKQTHVFNSTMGGYERPVLQQRGIVTTIALPNYEMTHKLQTAKSTPDDQILGQTEAFVNCGQNYAVQPSSRKRDKTFAIYATRWWSRWHMLLNMDLQ